MPLKPSATACFLAGITLFFYGYRPQPALTPVESAIVQQSVTPRAQVFFHEGDERWLMPAPVYATALMRSIAAPEKSVRVASVAMAALSVALMFLCARRMFGNDTAGVIAAILLLFMPAHLVLAQHGGGAIYQIPLVLLALWSAVGYLKEARRGHLIAAAVALAAGIYTHPTAPLTMTFLAAAFAGVLAFERRPPRDVAVFVAAFLAGFLPAAIWFASNPDSYNDTFGRWVILKGHIRNPVDGIRAFVNWNTLGTRVSLYWGFFDPAWLFIDDRRAASPLLLFFMPPLVWGLLKSRPLWPQGYVMVCLGAIVGPLAGSSFGDAHAVANVAALLPFLALMAAAGAVAVLPRRNVVARAVVLLVAVGLVVEFSRFYFGAIT